MHILHGNVSEKVIKSFYHVYNTLGCGFLEKVYENALRVSLRKLGVEVAQQMPVAVHFEEEVVGEYFADLLVSGVIVVEVKVADAIAPEHEAQVINYLNATGYQVGMILNFGPKPEFRRKVLTHPHSHPR